MKMSREDRQIELRERTRQLLHGSLKHVQAAALAVALVPLAAVAMSPAVAQAQGSGGAPLALVDLTGNPAAFPAPVGIACQATSGKLVTSVNASSGLPNNFDLLDPVTGQITQFSPVSGAIGEIKVASIHVSANQGGFAAGEIYAGTGVAGQILKISPDGSVVTNPWVILPGESAPITGLFQDKYGVAGGDLVVVTGNEQNGTATDLVGNVWRINSSGIATLLRRLGKHLEGVTTVPSDTVKYGPLAGQILAGDEDRLLGPERDGPQCRIVVIDPISGLVSATVSTDATTPASGSIPANYHVPVALCPEDLDVIPEGAPFFGVDFSGNRILTAPASDFANFAGDLLVTKEFPTGDQSVPATGGLSDSGLSVLHWSDVFQAFGVTSLSTILAINRWEQVTFAGTTACGESVVTSPAVTIVKSTNGADANDPNAAGVPNIAAGGSVAWTYRVTNTGNTSIPRADVVVTDNTPGVTPTFTSVISGNGDTIFDPGEVWLYTATGTSLDLTVAPPPGVHTASNSCTAGGTQPARTAYTNIGTVTIPGASASDQSSYCNPLPPQISACVIGYPFSTAGNTRTSVVFNESETLAGFSLGGTSANPTVQAFYNDEHAMLLGVRTTSFPVSPLNANPGHVANPAVGDSGQSDPESRPFFPSLFITDITGISDNASHTSQAYRGGDWQFGGAAIPPNDVFGTWKGAGIGIVDKKKKTIGMLTDADPAKNGAKLGPGSDTPVPGTGAGGYGAEARWNLAGLTIGRTYRLQFMVHDGDQNKTGGDVGEGCAVIRR
jgi:hypothetical protein